MKPYKTFNKQLKILRERGMEVPTNGGPKRFLEQENYYNVVNGYKDLFLRKDNNGNAIEPERYLEGTHFDELKNLFLFDRELRMIFLKYLLIFENSLKTTIAYEFSKEHPEKNSYLDLKNFTDQNPKKVLQQISILTNTIHSKVSQEGPVKHYIENHGEVPLWVLVNYLTIGNISHFYNILTPSIQNKIVKFYATKYNRQYKKQKKLKISIDDFRAGLKISNLIRNICAHDERLYNHCFKNIRITNIANYHDINDIDNTRCFVEILFLKVVLEKNSYNRFHSELSKLFSKYHDKFNTVNFEKILSSMSCIEREFSKLK
ncbi:Abi family protein [Streptococcus sobrinus]|uniref:Abi family protein n=2 Tax=Streptococcus sobrinus TaxID=1310 RepID=UPI0002E99A15|nr:Abi family protein [Streptococcus sobrinus]OZV22098.1 CAAX protease [Streptococcus sobrinus]